jgi:hypothetical protein
MRRIFEASAWTAILLIGASVIPWQYSPAVARTPKKVAPHPLQVRYDGTLELEGDYHRPGETRLHRSEQRFYCEPQAFRCGWGADACAPARPPLPTSPDVRRIRIMTLRPWPCVSTGYA